MVGMALYSFSKTVYSSENGCVRSSSSTGPLFPDHLKLLSMMTDQPLILEACVESLTEACWAEAQQATQIELCADLAADGLTPPIRLIEAVMQQIAIPIKVMIRSRGGDFEYSEQELELMLAQIEAIRPLGIDRFVLGMTRRHQAMHFQQLERVIAAFPDIDLTIHKVIDQLADPVATVTALRAYPSVKSVLTSGQAATAREGSSVIRQMIEAAGDDLLVIAAGKVTQENLAELHQLIGAQAYHGRKIVG